MGLDFFESINAPLPPNLPNNSNPLSGIKFLSQNVNSLNLSHSNLNTDLDKLQIKLNSVLKTGANIIMLQDVRMGQNINKLRKYLTLSKFGNFELFDNSSKGERGIITLIKKNLPYTVHKIIKSSCENILILDIIIIFNKQQW